MEMTWEYIAGFFDGEGSVGKHALTVSNTDLPSLEAIHTYLGCGHIRPRKTIKQGAVRRRLPLYDLVITKHVDLERILYELTPRSIIKRPAMLALSARLTETSPRKNHGLVTAFGVEKIRHLYETEGMSCPKIAAIIGTTDSAVHNFMVKNNIPRREKSSSSLNANNRRRAKNGITAQVIKQMYVVENGTLENIAAFFGCSPSPILTVMRSSGIPRRTMAEAIALRSEKYATGALMHPSKRPK
jgi:hypothetical protein